MRNEIEELTCLCTRTRLAFLPEPRFEKQPTAMHEQKLATYIAQVQASDDRLLGHNPACMIYLLQVPMHQDQIEMRRLCAQTF